MMRTFLHGLFLAIALLGSIRSAALETNGLAVKFTSADGNATDIAVLPNLWLFVEGGKPATPFLPPGGFTAEFNGFISAELRATYYFKAEQLAGTLKFEINGQPVLFARGTGGETALSKAVQLSKGPNPVKLTLTSAGGDTFVRIGWTEKGTNVSPIPAASITHTVTPDTAKAGLLALGRELFIEHRCARCHGDKAATPIPELSMDVPDFQGLGLRRRAEWMARWILDPKAMRASVHMPKLLHGAARADADAISAFLATLQTEPAPAPNAAVPAYSLNAKATAEIDQRSGPKAKPSLAGGNELPDTGGERKPLFERLHCQGCHNPPDSSENDPAKISLKHVAAKFSDGKLVEFLLAPERHFAWIRMPNFKLADVEAKELAGYLLKSADKPQPAAPVAEKSVIDRGQKLVQTLGCLNCHTAGKLENQFAAPPLAKLAAEAKGCLADKPADSSRAPDFAFEPAQRDALLAFLHTDRASLSRHSPIEFAARQTRLLQCNACHGQIDFVPVLELLGGKLKPEWSAQFIAGQPFKVRADIHPKSGDWVPARMPAFRSRAQWLAEGMAEQQGYPPRTPDYGPIDEAAARLGHRMIGKDNGLSCISCHAVNDVPALEVFESEGVNLGLSGSRLLKPYFFRWMRNPLAIDPQTKMPAFFGEDGKSALTDYYNGDGEQQINALYNYIRQGETMPKPNTGQQ